MNFATHLILATTCLIGTSAYAGNLPDLKCAGSSAIQGADYQYSFVIENGLGTLTEMRTGQAAVAQIAAHMTCMFLQGGQTPGHSGGFSQDIISCVSWAPGAPATGFSVGLESDHGANKFNSGSVGIVLDDNSPVLPWSNSSILAGISCNN